MFSSSSSLFIVKSCIFCSCLDGLVDGWVDGWVCGWTGGWTKLLIYILKILTSERSHIQYVLHTDN